MPVLKEADRNAGIHRPVRSARGLTWRMKPRILSDGPGIPNIPSISAQLASALSASFRASRSSASTSLGRGLASRDVATPGQGLRSFPQRYFFRRQPGGLGPPQARDTSRTMHRAASIGRLRSVG